MSLPWSVTWRKALVSVPRLVPDVLLQFTSPEGPQPLVIKLPSRGKHLIPVYVFIPPSMLPAADAFVGLPVLIDFHGGGFVLGSCQEQAPFCAKFCRELRCVAISVDYRLGPYAQFPSALEDAEDVVNAVIRPEAPGYAELRQNINDFLTSKSRSTVQLDSTRVALSGFSSGGNLALNLVLSINPPQLSEPWPCPFPLEHSNEIPVLMYYAAIDLRKLPSEREIVAALKDAPKGFAETLKLESHLVPTYLPREKSGHLRASPGLAEIKNGGLHTRARCLVILAEKDNLTPQNEIWVQKAINEGRGNDIRLDKYLGVVHGYTQFPDSWLDEHTLHAKIETHNKAVDFVRGWWGRVG